MVRKKLAFFKRLPARFFRQESGKEPVREWLLALSISERRLIGEDIKCVEFGWPIGLPVCRPIGKGIFEVRTTLPTGRISRVLFYAHEDHMILLHGFIKKTQSTPKAELELARKRMRGLI